MEYTRLGSTGLKISRLALGTMSYGAPDKAFPAWAMDEDAAQPFFRQAVELGITFWDTANVYSAGSSEEIVGRAIREYSRREDIVLATKVHFPMHDGPGGSGLSRKAIMENIDSSLARLGTDFVDLYQIHRLTPRLPSRRRWRRCTTLSRPARPGTSAPRPCGPGSSRRCSMPPT